MKQLIYSKLFGILSIILAVSFCYLATQIEKQESEMYVNLRNNCVKFYTKTSTPWLADPTVGSEKGFDISTAKPVTAEELKHWQSAPIVNSNETLDVADNCSSIEIAAKDKNGLTAPQIEILSNENSLKKSSFAYGFASVFFVGFLVFLSRAFWLFLLARIVDIRIAITGK